MQTSNTRGCLSAICTLAGLWIAVSPAESLAQCSSCSLGGAISFPEFKVNDEPLPAICVGETVVIRIRSSDLDRCGSGCSVTNRNDDTWLSITITPPVGDVLTFFEDDDATGEIWESPPIDILVAGTYLILAESDDHCEWANDPPQSHEWTLEVAACCAEFQSCCSVDPCAGPDCNQNSIADPCEIECGLIEDCNENGIPDDCDIDPADPDGNGVVSHNCNNNEIPDECEIADGTLDDCDGDGVADQCGGACPPVHIVFVMDTSGSMNDEGSILCLNIDQVIQYLQLNENITATSDALGITETRWCLTDSVTNLLGPAVPDNPPPGSEYVNQYEDWGPATAVVAAFYPWPDGIRVIVPISDEGPNNGSPCCYDCDYQSGECQEPHDWDHDSILHAIAVANANDVIVSPIVGTGYGACDMDCIQDEAGLLATSTGGTMVLSTDAVDDLPTAIVDIVTAACAAFDDCNDNGEPDDCEPDCNGNGVPDDCDLVAHPEWDVDPENGILDECETPPDASIRVFNALSGDEIFEEPDGIWRVPECTDLRLDASDSGAYIPGGVTFAWDLDGQGVFAPADAQTPTVLHSNVSNGAAPAVSLVQVRVEDANGAYSVADVEIHFTDTGPQASLSGPATAMPDSLVCLDGAAFGPCDDIVTLEWDFDYEDGAFNADLVGIMPDDLSVCTSFPEPNPNAIVAMRVVDADDSEFIVEHTIVVEGSNPPYTSFSNDLSLDMRYHVHEDGDGNVRHRAQIHVVNIGDTSVAGPIFGTFDDLMPAGTTIVNAVPPGGPLDDLGLPYVELLPSGAMLQSGESAEWLWLEWDIPGDATERFGYDADVLLPQQPPYFVSEPPNLDEFNVDHATEGVLYQYDADARDPEELPIYYQLASTSTDPSAAVDPPIGMTINSETGVVSWFPSQTAAAEGPYAVTIIARDSYAGLYATQQYDLEVAAVNLPPEILSAPPTYAVMGDVFEYHIQAEDPDNDPLPLANYSLFLTPDIATLGGSDADPILFVDTSDTGYYQINLRLTDLEYTVKQDFLLQIVSCSPEDRPIIDRDADCAQGDMSDCEVGAEAEPYVKQINLSQAPDSGQLSYFLDIAPDGMEIDEDTGLIQWLPTYNDHGMRLVRVRAQATGQCKDTYAFIVDIEDRNGAPEIATADLGVATEGQQFIRTIVATDPDEDMPLTYSLTERPAGMLINSQTGQITWTPNQTAAADAPYAVSVKVEDPDGAFDEETYSLPVNPVNVAPQFTSLPTTVIVDGDFYSYQIKAFDLDNPADADGEELVYALVNGPDDMQINVNGNGLAEWQTTLGDFQNSPYFVRVSVTDGVHTVLQPFEINVYPVPPIPNDGPQIHVPPYPESYAIVLQEYTYQLDATDQDVIDGEDDWLDYRLENAPASMTIETSSDPSPGLIRMTPTVNDLTPEGEPRIYENIRVIVEDQRHAYAVLIFGLAVYPEGAGNQPPQIVSTPVHVAQVNQQYEYVVEAVDPDDASLEFDLAPAPANGPDGGPLLSPPSGMTIVPHGADPKKAIVRWTPTIDDVGMRWIKVTVKDPAHPTPSYQLYTLTASVVGNNNPPQIVSTPLQSATVGEVYEYAVDVHDPDPADVHSFELLQKPAGAAIHPTTGLIQWIPTAAQIGVRSFEVEVRDSGEAWARQYWGVAVNEPGDPCPNVPPEITSVPEQLVQAGTEWEYIVEFTDDNIADGALCDESLTLSLEQRPSGMHIDEIDPTKVVWPTSDPASIGTHHVKVRVTDARGAWYQQEFDVYVSDVLGNHGPQITSTPPALAQVGILFEYPVEFFDEDAGPIDVLTSTLEQKPSGATITQTDNNHAIVSWTPQPGQLGPSTFAVRVTDEHGAWHQQQFTLNVSLDGQNHAPQINSEPTYVVARGELYVYQVDASDADPGDELSFSLDDKPDGMTIHPNTGLIQWQTAPDQPLESHYVKVRVEDPQQAWATQAFYVTVSEDGTNRAPRIISTPTHQVELGQTYVYEVEATDEDGDSLDWSYQLDPDLGDVQLIVDPDTFTARLEWGTTDLTQPDTHYFRIHVDDNLGGWAEQYFSVTLWQGEPNRAPSFVSQPVTHATENTIYEYVIETTDPDVDDILTVTLPQQPVVGQVTFNEDADVNGKAYVTWDATGVSQGEYAFTARVADGNGGWAEQAFTVSVGPNLPPQIVSTPELIAIIGHEYTYPIEAHDPEGGELTYDFADGFTPPDDMDIADDPAGRLTWTPTTEGNQQIPIIVRDDATPPHEATQNFTVHVVTEQDGDFAAPIVTVALDVLESDIDDKVDLDPPATDDIVEITVTAADDLGIENNEVTLRIEGPIGFTPVEWVLSLTNGQAMQSFTPPQVGGYHVIATAVDLADHAASADAQFTAHTDATTESTDPQAYIYYPANESTDPDYPPQTPRVSGVVEVTGWAFDNNFDRYELAYRPIGDTGPYHTFYTGHQRVGFAGTPELLGYLDTTQMLNGTYDLLLSAYDVSGNTTYSIQTFAIEGGAKVGNFTMTFKDLEVQMAGVPITVTRTYDSRNKTRGDFGYGWEFDLAGIELQESFPIEQGWDVYHGGYGFTCALGEQLSHTISVTWPDGRLEVFGVQPNYQPNQYTDGCLGLQLNSYNPINIVRVSPGSSTLRLKNSGPEWIVNYDDGGRMTLDFDPYGAPSLWMAQGYILTTLDGTEYTFGARNPNTGHSRLTHVARPNGQAITITQNGVFPDEGPGILIQRDAQNRIHKIIDPSQNDITYQYDAAGDLIAVTDRTDNTMQFVYNDAHGLLEVIDPRGITVGRTIYDDNDRVITLIDAAGMRTEHCRPSRENPPDHCVSPADLTSAENPHGYTLPDLGMGQCADYEAIVDPALEGTMSCYDEDGLITFSIKTHEDSSGILFIDALEHTVYDTEGRPASFVDASGKTTTRQFQGDTQLILSETTQVPGGMPRTTAFSYNNYGQERTSTDPLGNTTEMQYDEHGNLIGRILPEPGYTTTYLYENGRLNSLTDGTEKTTLVSYDDLGRVESLTNHAGYTTDYTYDDNGNRLSETRIRTLSDGTEQTVQTLKTYDAAGRETSRIDGLGHATTTAYNSIGKPESVTNPRGFTTSTEYDANARVERVIYPDGSTEEYTYDAKGRKHTLTNRDGRVSRYEYDGLGRQTKVFGPVLNPGDWTNVPFTESTYDAAGRLRFVYRPRTASEPQVLITEHRYEGDEQIVIHYNDGQQFATTSFLDAAGRVDHVRDARNNDISYEYDGNGQRIREVYPATVHNPVTMNETVYDHAGRKLAEIDQSGKSKSYEYDVLGRLHKVIDADLNETTYLYDELGNLIKQIDAEQRETTMTYDAAGRLISRTLPLGQTETFAYDNNGNKVRHTSFNGDTILFDYDENDRMIRKTLSGGTMSGDALDPPVSTFESGTCTWQLSADSSSLTIYCDHQVADASGARIQYSNAHDGSLVFDLGSGQSPISMTVPMEPIDLQEFNDGMLFLVISAGEPAAPRIAVHLNPQTTTVDYAYTPAGLRTQAGGDTYEYNDRGLLEYEYKTNGDVIRYEYDSPGNRTLVEVTRDGDADPTTKTRYEFDDLSRLWKVFDVTPGGEVLATEYAYDEVGNRERVINHANGTETVHAYDSLNRLISLVNREINDGPVISSYEYILGPAGHRLRVIEHHRGTGGGPRTVDYDYDDLYRVTLESISNDPEGDDFLIAYDYDKVGNREQKTFIASDQTVLSEYNYDVNDRLISQTQTVQLARGPKLDQGARYARHEAQNGSGARYFLAAFAGVTSLTLLTPLTLLRRRRNSIGRRMQRRRVWRATMALFALPVMLIGADNVVAQHNEAILLHVTAAGAMAPPDPIVEQFAYTYDDNGNHLTRNDGVDEDTFTYDVENRLVAANRSIDAAVSATYAYDADGIRTRVVLGSETTHYTTDKNRAYAQVLVESTDSDVVTYLYGDDLIRMTRPGDVLRYYQYDGQMSTRQLIDETGAVVDSYTYDAFGVKLQTTGTTVNNYLYTGEQYDPGSGGYYLRARYYTQDNGRFLTRDTHPGSQEDPLSLHKYTYVHNSPTNYVDPSGMTAVALGGGGLAGLISVASIAIYSAFAAISALLTTQVLIGLTILVLAIAIVVLLPDILPAAQELLETVLSQIGVFMAAARDAAVQAARATGRQLARLLRQVKIFPIIRSLGPTIFAFDSFALALSPVWFVLNYNGPLSPATVANRAIVNATWGFLRLTAPLVPPHQLDEFPYASTWQGGFGALGMMVPAAENRTQGGMLGAFYRLALRNVPGSVFLVVPVPI